MNKYSKYITIAEETEKEVLRLRNSNSPPWTHLKTLVSCFDFLHAIILYQCLIMLLQNV